MTFAKYRDEIAGILDERFYPLAWVEAEIEAGRIGLMENETAIIGITRKEYPGGASEIHGMFAAGEREGILELIDQACVSAKQAGCDVATIASRPAWAKLLKSRGFAPCQTTITKELS